MCVRGTWYRTITVITLTYIFTHYIELLTDIHTPESLEQVNNAH
jgi:hypothetical protein